MNTFDPLVSIEPATQAGHRGWAVAAAIIARLQEVGLSGAIDIPAILGPAISDLGASELEEPVASGAACQSVPQLMPGASSTPVRTVEAFAIVNINPHLQAAKEGALLAMLNRCP